jgi:surface antigen
MKYIKKTLTACIVGTIAINLAGCANWSKQDTGVAVGAGTGAALGGLLFHGDSTIPAMIIGGVAGGLIGGSIGRSMDEQDRANMSRAITTTPVNQTASWTNTTTHTTYQVTPVRNYKTTTNRYCREYQTTVIVGGEAKKAYGTACRQPDGQWKIVK